MDEQENKTKLQILYDDIKNEVEGKYTSTGVYIPPSAYSYYIKAKALVDEAIILSKTESSIDIGHILHTLNKEVSYVKDYDGKRKTPKKQQQELDTLMRKATHKLYVDLCPLVTND